MQHKSFTHLSFPEDKYVPIERIDSELHRLYRVPGGDAFPSVTSVLSMLSDTHISEWRARVGEEEANLVSQRASLRGTAVHELCEDYLNNRLNSVDVNPFILVDFIPIKNVLDISVDNIFHTEIQMFSRRLKSAGTADLIAEFDGVQSIVDFKTSARDKYETDIESYFMQGAAYAFMAYEMFGITLEDIVVIIMRDGDPIAKVFKKKSRDYIGKFLEIRKEFEEINHL